MNSFMKLVTPFIADLAANVSFVAARASNPVQQ
jgi:hypothetical protein